MLVLSECHTSVCHRAVEEIECVGGSVTRRGDAQPTSSDKQSRDGDGGWRCFLTLSRWCWNYISQQKHTSRTSPPPLYLPPPPLSSSSLTIPTRSFSPSLRLLPLLTTATRPDEQTTLQMMMFPQAVRVKKKACAMSEVTRHSGIDYRVFLESIIQIIG